MVLSNFYYILYLIFGGVKGHIFDIITETDLNFEFVWFFKFGRGNSEKIKYEPERKMWNMMGTVKELVDVKGED